MKLEKATYVEVNELVAPHAGAWIETQSCPYEEEPSYVAPHAGAWIET